MPDSGQWPIVLDAAVENDESRRRGAVGRCAEEDSNLHPVIPDQALNLVAGIVALHLAL